MNAFDELNQELNRTAVLSDTFKDRIGVLVLRAMEQARESALQAPPEDGSNAFDPDDTTVNGLLHFIQGRIFTLESVPMLTPDEEAELEWAHRLLHEAHSAGYTLPEHEES